MKKILEKDIFWLILLLVLVLLQTRFLFAPGFYTFSDEPHIANLHQMVRALSGGQLPPRWAPDMSFNFGYPLFNFYYPLPFYFGAVLKLGLKLSLIWSLKATFFISVLLSAFAFYFLTSRLFSRQTAFSSTIVYLYTPYRAVDLYVRGAVGEMWGFIFMPLVLGLALDLVKKRKLKLLAITSLSLAGLFLAHNLTPIIFLPVLAFLVITYLITSLPNKKRGKALAFFLLAIIWGLIISAYYWLPAVYEKRFIQSGTPFNPVDHFPFLKQLVFPSWGYGASVWGPNDGMSFQIGVVNLLTFVAGGLLLITRWKTIIKTKRWFLLASLLLFLVVVFLMNIRSMFIWKILPLGDYIQFPWRLLMLTTFLSSLVVGFTEMLIKNKFARYIPLGLAVLSLILTFNYFKPGKEISVDDNYFLKRFFINQSSFGETKELSSEYLSYSEDYLPPTVWTQKRPNKLPEKIVASGKINTLSWEEKTPTDFQVMIDTPSRTTLTINNYYFPGWEVLIDGQKTVITPEKPYGQMKIEVPEGRHSVKVKLKESQVKKVADGISLIGILALAIILVLKPRTKLGS